MTFESIREAIRLTALTGDQRIELQDAITQKAKCAERHPDEPSRWYRRKKKHVRPNGEVRHYTYLECRTCYAARRKCARCPHTLLSHDDDGTCLRCDCAPVELERFLNARPPVMKNPHMEERPLEHDL